LERYKIYPHTNSPFLYFGGSQEMIILVFDDGIAFIPWGADGTENT
jgi:hypothetical protein